jgi:hypothetical protein
MTVKSTKRISGDYEIYAGANVAGNYSGTVRVYGNLDVVGNTTYIESTNTQIKDALITLNQGETGAGVTVVYSGVEVERGSSPNVIIRWNEGTGKWELTNDGSTYVPIALGSTSVSGADTQVQFNDGGAAFGGNVNFTYNKTTNTLTAGGVVVNNYTISTDVTNQNLVLDPNGIGAVVINATVKLADQGSDPVASASNNYVYSKTPSVGGSGVFFVNTTDSGELVSTKKARRYALIF